MASSVFFLWLAMRRVSQPDVLAAFRVADWRLAVPAALLLILSWGVFAARWRLLLTPSGSVGWLDAFAYLLIGQLGNAVLPLRLGDLGRITLASRKFGIGVGSVAAAGVLEKFLDMLTMLALAAALMLVVPIPEAIRLGVQAAVAASAGALVVLAGMASSQSLLVRLQALVAPRLPQGVTRLAFAVAGQFVQALKASGGVVQLPKVIFLSLVSWGIVGLSLLCFIRAFGLAVPWAAAPLVMVAVNLGGAIPSSPGGIGVFEFLASLALSAWLQDGSLGLAFAVFVHAMNLGLIVALGLAAAWREGVGWAELQSGFRK